jgi:hypothetical protein
VLTKKFGVLLGFPEGTNDPSARLRPNKMFICVEIVVIIPLKQRKFFVARYINDDYSISFVHSSNKMNGPL